jgi:cytochrome o ubiquinol oxidase subunit 1
VSSRDPFWEQKQALERGEKPEKLVYKDIVLPKSSGMGIIIAGFAFLVGFGLIWHMWWLAVVGLVGVVICVIIRTSNDDTDYTITAAQIKRLDHQAHVRGEQYV